MSKRPKKSNTKQKVSTRSVAKASESALIGVQIGTIITFFMALLALLFVAIPGERAWNSIHSFLLGMNGLCAFGWPVMVMYISVLTALGKSSSRWFRTRVVLGAAFVFLAGALCDVFALHSDQYSRHLPAAYTAGRSLKGGGLLGGLLGWPLQEWFGTFGAATILIIVMLILLLIITGTTLIQFFRAVSRPAKGVQTVTREAILNRQKTEEERRRAFDLVLQDAPDKSDMPRPEELEAKKKRLLRSYKNDDVPHDRTSDPLKTHQADDAADSNNETDMEQIIRRAQGAGGQQRKASSDKTSPTDTVPLKPASEERAVTPISGISLESSEKDVYRFPPLSLLKKSNIPRNADVSNELKNNAERLVDTLRSFGVETRIIDISRGPAVTRYEIQPSAGVKISKITNLADDIALNLATAGVRIEAPIPNKAAVGIEVPNRKTALVSVADILDSSQFSKAKSKLTVALGKDLTGDVVTADLGKMPHLLIAGATGSGKSVCINSLIVSLLYKASPHEVKLLMIDPKVVELGLYNGIPHLLVPVVTDPRKAAGALGWAVTEMLQRYKLFAEHNVRDLVSYNALAHKNEEMEPMARVVIVIDELADLMMVAPGDVEDSICRLAQMARAAGMHLVIATQRPSVDVITGIIKANIPSRIAFAVTNQFDSRTILDMGGAEKLLGRGDMLYYPVGATKPTRVQGCFVSDEEIESIIEFIKGEDTPEYSSEIMEEIEKNATAEKGSKKGRSDATNDTDGDEMLPQAIECVVEAGMASTSLLQRRLKLGYARAARIVDQMEERGIVGPFDGSKPRKVLITKQQWYEMKTRSDDGQL